MFKKFKVNRLFQKTTAKHFLMLFFLGIWVTNVQAGDHSNSKKSVYKNSRSPANESDESLANLSFEAKVAKYLEKIESHEEKIDEYQRKIIQEFDQHLHSSSEDLTSSIAVGMALIDKYPKYETLIMQKFISYYSYEDETDEIVHVMTSKKEEFDKAVRSLFKRRPLALMRFKRKLDNAKEILYAPSDKPSDN